MMPTEMVQRIASVAAVLVFVWLISFIDLSTLASALNALPAWAVAYVFIAQLFLYAVKAYRFSILNPNIPFSTMLVAVIYHNFFLGLLPFRLGELAYIKYLREHHVSVSKLVSDIIVVRSFDATVLAVFGVFTIPLVVDIASWLHLAIIAAVCITVVIVIYGSEWLLEGMIRLLGRGRIRFSVLEHVIRLFQHMQSIGTRKKVALIIVSFLVWIVMCAVWIPLVGVLTGLNLSESAVSTLVAMVFSILPLNPPAGIGVIEGGWTAGLMLFDVPVKIAVTTALLLHALAIAIVFVFSAVAKVYDYGLEYRKNKNSFL
jgi:uncharacterized membrane protein YbhN (UPF0104 family)